MKTCFKCGRTLPSGEFYRHPMMADGRLGKCKECTKSDVILNRDLKLEYYRAYDQSRPRRESKKSQAWTRRHSRVHQIARRAHATPEPCFECGAPGQHRHHPDYSAPAEIVWLCTGCHGREHARLRRLSK